MPKIEENWQAAPTSVQVGFVLGIPCSLFGIVLVFVGQWYVVPWWVTIVGCLCLSTGLVLVLRLTQGRFPGGVKPDPGPDLWRGPVCDPGGGNLPFINAT